MSYVYVFDFGDMVKVGYSQQPEMRLRQLIVGRESRQTHIIEANRTVEKKAHQILASYRIEGEYFSCSFNIARDTLNALVDKSKIVGPVNLSANPAFTVRIHRDGVQKLDYIAGVNGRSRNNEINQAVKQYIKKFEEENGEINIKKD